jgi:hypothetical protein
MVDRFEIGKDTVQVLAESAAGHAGRIATIVSGAVREVTREVGDWASATPPRGPARTTTGDVASRCGFRTPSA